MMNGQKNESDFIFYVEKGTIKWFLIYFREIKKALLINRWHGGTYIQDSGTATLMAIDEEIDLPKNKEEALNLINMFMVFQ